MDLDALISEVRTRADDAVAPHLTGDAQLTAWANEAEREACVRARLLFDDTDRPGITTIAVVPGQHSYTLSPLVLFIDAASYEAVMGGRPRDLELRGLDWIRDQRDWQYRSSNRPHVLSDDGRDRVRLWATPSTVGTLRLHVYRLPLVPMEDLDDEPEIHEMHHSGLIEWVMYRYWSQKDSENYDPARAEAAKAEFTARFGERNTADVMRKHRERRRITTRYGGL